MAGKLQDPGAILFTVIDPEGREIGLNQGAWDHLQKHPGVTQEMIKDTLERPDEIRRNDDHGSLNYAAFVPERRFFRLVCVKEWPGRMPRFQVATAYNPALPPGGTLVWRKSWTP